jgi:transcriptional regulator with XRE-family HTH domain
MRAGVRAMAIEGGRVGFNGASTAGYAMPVTEDGGHGVAEDEQPESYQRRLGARLRALRRARGLRLQDVELRSGGRFKAVVIGSYERGDRAIAAHRLAALAAFYDVPLEDVLPDTDRAHHRPRGRDDDVVLAVDVLAARTDPEVAPLQRLVHHVQWQRGDYNGRMLTMRGDDLRTVAVSVGMAPDGYVAWLSEEGLLVAS